MSDSFFYAWVLATGFLPQLLMTTLFIAFIVGLFVRFVRSASTTQ